MDEKRKYFNPNPIYKSNLLSRLFYCWINPIFSIGYKRNLEIEDIYNVLPEDSSEHLSNKLEKHWKTELLMHQNSVKKGSPSLLRALFKTFGFHYTVWSVAIVFEETLRILQTFLLGGLIRYFSPNSQMQMWEGYLYASSIGLCAVLLVLTHHPYFLAIMKYGMRMRIATCSLIYRKSLRLSSASLGETTTGQIVNLMSNDVQRMDQGLLLSHYLVLGPIETVVIFVILWYKISWSSLAGLSVIVFIWPITFFLGRVISNMRNLVAIETDERVQRMNEVLNAMRIIKMYCWESLFKDVIMTAREREVSRILTTTIARVASISPEFFSAKLIAYFTFLAYILTGNVLTAEVVFVTISLYNPVRLVMMFFFPLAIQHGSELLVTIRRVQKFLLMEEMKEVPRLLSNPSIILEPKIALSGVTAGWNPNLTQFVLNNVSFEVGPGELLAVIGPVGAGKTSLLMAILKELSLTAGNIDINGRLAYVSQQPWVFSASIRQNVIFGNVFDNKRYNKAIFAAGLTKDISLMADGDQTLVGERGISLSGGQKARLSLARALYDDADVYLLDDPLSAVDANIGNHIFTKCICGYLKMKPRILVTHQLQYLKSADQILILTSEGNNRLGTFEELTKNGIDIIALLKQQSESDSKTVARLSVSGPNDFDEVFVRQSSVKFDDEQRMMRAVLSKSFDNIDFGGPFDSESTKSLLDNSRPFKSMLSKSLNFLHISFDDDDRTTMNRRSGSSSRARGNPSSVFSAISLGSIALIDSEGDYIPPALEEEGRASGHVKPKLYFQYMSAGCGYLSVVLCILLNILAQTCTVVADWWLAYWCTEIEEYKQKQQLLDHSNSTSESPWNSSLSNSTVAPSVWTLDSDFPHNTTYLLIFTGICGSVVVFGLIRPLQTFHLLLKSSKCLHNRMLDSILRSPITFFDNNPIGRILNRFAKDLGLTDEILPFTMYDFFECALQVISVILVVCITIPWVFIPTVPLGAAFLYLRYYYLESARDVKRIESTTRSPVYSHISATVLGIQTIRSYSAEELFVKEFDSHQDLHTSAYYMVLIFNRWFAVRLEWMCAIFIMIVALLCVFISQSLNDGTVGLSLSYAITLMALFQWTVRQSSEVESMMTTVERLFEYTELPAEAPLESNKMHQPPSDWPSAGAIKAVNLALRYKSDGPIVLDHLSFSVEPCEKIGIVGRTGAGKSSLITTLFRLVEPTGSLLVDGIDITQLGLHDLRKKISIIPQDPVLMSGTIRKNLDPANNHTDMEIWFALQQVQLSNVIKEMEDGLNTKIRDEGGNISMGQRQLLCLARAILKCNKILVIDEATANVDPRTDFFIQQAIREQFKHCTVLTIAHRLKTVADSDRIMVLDQGKIVEFDSPYILLQNEKSFFYQLAKQTSESEFDHLVTTACKAYTENKSKRYSINSSADVNLTQLVDSKKS